MAKSKYDYCKVLLCALFFGFVLGGCSTTKSNYQKEYTRVWKEIIKSEAWKNSLLAKNTGNQENGMEFIASNEEVGIVDDDFTTKLNMESLFEERFHSLVSRAYFKIIAEAENADVRLTTEYDHWNTLQKNMGLKRDKDFRKKYEAVLKKYHAHRQMLEGLKSWNIFSEFRSDDLDFFKAENKERIREMYQNGSTEDNMINYLVYRLADLYHFED